MILRKYRLSVYIVAIFKHLVINKFGKLFSHRIKILADFTLVKFTTTFKLFSSFTVKILSNIWIPTIEIVEAKCDKSYFCI